MRVKDIDKDVLIYSMEYYFPGDYNFTIKDIDKVFINNKDHIIFSFNNGNTTIDMKKSEYDKAYSEYQKYNREQKLKRILNGA